jgi:metallo-beta-lactamase family protein
MVLSHAHIDHSGNIPTLVREGFAGPIYCTSATRDLCRIMLLDSAHVQAHDIEHVNRKRAQAGEPRKTPVYTVGDAERCLDSFVAQDYGVPFQPWDGLQVSFHDAGHILGSSLILLEAGQNGESLRYLFTGDLGRKHLPLLRDPEQVLKVDYLQIESTYGNRQHGSMEETREELGEVVRAAHRQKGKIIIPAFSIGRTQDIVYELRQLEISGRIPWIKAFVDSPLAVDATEIYRKHPECFDQETRDLLARHQDPLGLSRLTYVQGQEESKKLNHIRGACIIISASGMCEGGRVLHHLIHSLDDRRNTILFVGYQAQGTLGRRLVEGERSVRIFGEEYSVRARVAVLNGFSAHADRDELLGYVAAVGGELKGAFVVHGDPDQSRALGEGIRSWNPSVSVRVPSPGEEQKL